MDQRTYDLRLEGLITAFRRCSIPEVKFCLSREIWNFQHVASKRVTPLPSVECTAEIQQAIRRLEQADFNRKPFLHRLHAHIGRWLGVQ